VTVTDVLSILVVDDEFDIAELLAELLASRGHRVTTAINGLLGRELLAAHAYDLVITDYMMPIIDGIQLVKTMRADPRLAQIPVILISGRHEISSAADGLVQATLRKPFSPRAMYAAIDRVIADQRGKRSGDAA
jgi:CheY-like chemotaxis protein